MNRAEIINKLKAAEPQLRAHGIAGLYLFGSYARDEAQPESDVDVFIDKAQAEGSVSTSLWAAILPSKMLFPASKSASERARDSINFDGQQESPHPARPYPDRNSKHHTEVDRSRSADLYP